MSSGAKCIEKDNKVNHLKNIGKTLTVGLHALKDEDWRLWIEFTVMESNLTEVCREKKNEDLRSWLISLQTWNQVWLKIVQ